MHFKFFLPLALVFTTTVPGWGSTAPVQVDASPCEDDLSSVRSLSDGQKDALREMRRGHYSIRVLTKTIGGVERTVVLVGEMHVKSFEDAQRGQRVIGLFRDRAEEGSETVLQGFWSKKALAARLEAEWTAAHAVFANMKEFDFTQGSSIKDSSVIRVGAAQWEAMLLGVSHRRIDEGHTTQEQEIAFLRARYMDKMVLAHYGEIPNARAVLAAINVEHVVTQLKSGKRLTPEETLASYAPRPTTDLERGYRPPLSDQIIGSVWGLAPHARFAMGRTALYTGAFLTGLSAYLSSAPDAVLTASGLAVLTSRLILKYADAKGFSRSIGNRRSRDLPMAANVQRVLTDDPSITELLVTVGNAHSAGLVSHLEAGGFELNAQWLRSTAWPSPAK